MNQEQFPQAKHQQPPVGQQDTGNPEGVLEAPSEGEQYWQKVDYLGNMIFGEEVTKGIVDTQQKLLASAPNIPGRQPFESVDVLPSIKPSLLAEVSQRTRDEIAKAKIALGSEQDDDETIKRLKDVVAYVETDMFGPDGKGGGADAAIYVEGHEPSSGLDMLVSEESGVEVAIEDMPKVEAVMRVLLASGQYKLLKWNSGHTLGTSLRLLEDMTAIYPDFSPDQAGAFDLVSCLSRAAAATRVELSSKPNYQYAKPEISALNNQLLSALRSISRVKAQIVLRTHDFELPPTEQPISTN